MNEKKQKKTDFFFEKTQFANLKEKINTLGSLSFSLSIYDRCFFDKTNPVWETRSRTIDNAFNPLENLMITFHFPLQGPILHWISAQFSVCKSLESRENS